MEIGSGIEAGQHLKGRNFYNPISFELYPALTPYRFKQNLYLNLQDTVLLCTQKRESESVVPEKPEFK